ncbi:MAG: hypothetical protein K0R09_1487 [Clostridiales bacterium]|jgi:uncharacterized MnhB-related membrane protein|nr:hypothetical protein [Clostridiales bacterium]
MNSIFILNTLVMIGIIVAAILAVVFDKLLSSIIALGVVGSFMVLEFILLHAPDVAMAEAVIGAVLSPIIFIIALKKVKGGREE